LLRNSEKKYGGEKYDQRKTAIHNFGFIVAATHALGEASY